MSGNPEPLATHVVCTSCGLSWDKHLTGPRKKTPTFEDCVRVLKAELAGRPRHQQSGSSVANGYFFGAQGGTTC